MNDYLEITWNGTTLQFEAVSGNLVAQTKDKQNVNRCILSYRIPSNSASTTVGLLVSFRITGALDFVRRPVHSPAIEVSSF
jgi:hypothetical protein